MKKLPLIIIVVALFSNLSSAKVKTKESVPKELLVMQKQVDKIDGREFFFDKKLELLDPERAYYKLGRAMGLSTSDLSERNRNFALSKYSTGIEPYIGRIVATRAVFLKIKYILAAENWIYVKSYKVVVDGNPIEFVPSGLDRDAKGGAITETYSQLASDKDIQLLRGISSSKEAVIRFYGEKGYVDHEFTKSEKAAYTRILKAYDFLKSVPLK